MTTLLEDYTRAQNGDFRNRVRSALFRYLPNIIGEAAAAATSPGGTGTEAKRQKRHRWAMSVLEDPDKWVGLASIMLAGENDVQAVPLGDETVAVSDTVIDQRLRRLIDDLAGCEVTDTP